MSSTPGSEERSTGALARDVLIVVSLALGASLLRVGWRWQHARAVAASTGVPAAMTLIDADSAYRLRLAELTLETGSVPFHDRMVAPTEGASVPWPPLATSVLATLSGRGTSDEREDTLARTALWLPPLVLGLAVLALFAAARTAGASRAAASVMACGFGLLAPGGEPGGAFAGAGSAACLMIAIVAMIRLVRARHVAGLVFCALVVGCAGAGACLLDLTSLPAFVLALTLILCGSELTFWAARREEWPEHSAQTIELLAKPHAARLGFGGTLALAAASLLVWLAVDSSATVGGFHPAAGLTRLFIFLMLEVGAVWAVRTLGPRGQRASGAADLPTGLTVSFVFLLFCAVDDEARDWATMAIARRADLDWGPVLLASVCFVLALCAGLLRYLPRAVARALAGLVVLVALVCGPGPGLGEREEIAARADLVGALRRMRRETRSAGPWNDPDARPDWHVEAPTELAGLVLWHARSPVGRAPWSSAATTPARYRLVVGEGSAAVEAFAP